MNLYICLVKKTVIIVAGGTGRRMGGDMPKQFLPIAGKPMLVHTIQAFIRYDKLADIVLVLPEAYMTFWEQRCQAEGFELPCRVVVGGPTRFHSVKRGLECCRPDGLIAVHDGARPLVGRDTIARCFERAGQTGAAMPVVPLTDSLRRIGSQTGRACDRAHYVLVQTPQVFAGNLLMQAYRQEYNPAFTDDASVVEAFGHPVTTVEGERENIKVTTPFDLKIAEIILNERLFLTLQKKSQ